MKKTYTFLLIFCLETSLMICCDSSKKQIHPYDHMATIAALVTSAALLPEERRRLYYPSISLFTARLSTATDDFHTITLPRTHSAEDDFSEYVILNSKKESTHEDTFALFTSPHSTRKSIFTAKNKALKIAQTAEPVAIFTTKQKHQFDCDRIHTFHHENRAQCNITVTHLLEESQTEMVVTNPTKSRSFFYYIGKEKSMYPSESSIQSMIVPFPDQDILIKAYTCENDDDSNQIVKIWTFAQEPLK